MIKINLQFFGGSGSRLMGSTVRTGTTPATASPTSSYGGFNASGLTGNYDNDSERITRVVESAPVGTTYTRVDGPLRPGGSPARTVLEKVGRNKWTQKQFIEGRARAMWTQTLYTANVVSTLWSSIFRKG